MNETYEAIYRIASALYSEYELSGKEGYITYQEVARLLNRFGYEKQDATLLRGQVIQARIALFEGYLPLAEVEQVRR